MKRLDSVAIYVGTIEGRKLCACYLACAEYHGTQSLLRAQVNPLLFTRRFTSRVLLCPARKAAVSTGLIIWSSHRTLRVSDSLEIKVLARISEP